MKGRNQQQLSMEMLEAGRRVQAETVQEAFSFGPFRVIPHARLLEREGAPKPLSSRAFDLLCILVRRPGEVVSKGELLARAWPEATVEEGSLRFHITMLRRALGDGQGGERYVVNIPGRGYCFVACVGRDTSPSRQNDGNHTADRTSPVRTDWQLAPA